MARVAVVGAGVVGLSTALRIQQEIPGVKLTVLAEKFKDTTSHGVPGIFRPTLSKTPGVAVDLLKTWLRDSWQHYHSLNHSTEAGRAGVQIISGYQFVNNPNLNELERDFVYSHRPLSDKEMQMFPGDRFNHIDLSYTTAPTMDMVFKLWHCVVRHGWAVTTFTVEPAIYIPYLTAQIERNGGNFVSCGHLSTLETLVGQYDIVVNCAGLGNRQLLDDDKLVPIRGCLIKVKAPWIKHFVYTGDAVLSYIIPGHNVVHIGGTHDHNDMEPNLRQAERERILADAYRVLPSLKTAPVVSEFVGWRPFRAPLRVETETIQYPSGAIKVVHNYGHGAEGVSLSWGTACHAARLVQDQLKSSASKL